MARKSRKNVQAPPEHYDAAAYIRVAYDVGAYVRLSAVDRKQKGDSIEIQQAIIKAYIEKHPGLTLREIYIDNGTSGMTFERPAFQKMLSDAEAGKINCLITKDLSRLGRNAIDTSFYIERYFPSHGLRFIAINDNYDSAEGNTGGLMVTLKNIINETYALEVGRKIRATKQMNIREGAFVGRFPPYGYLKSSEDGHKLVVDTGSAPVVRRIFEMAADGCAVSGITKYLNGNGIPTPRHYFIQKGIATEKEADANVHWSKGAVYRILHNRVYTGDMVQGKFRTANHVEKLLPASEWIVTPNTHEPVIGRELWERVRLRWAEQRRGEPEPYSENLFRGKIFCGHCGYAMRRVRHGKTAYGFTCETRQIYDKADCVQVSISEAGLKEQLLAMLQEQAEDFRGCPAAEKPIDTEISELRDIRRQVETCGGYLKSLYENLTLGNMTDDEYRDLKRSYEDKISQLNERERLLRESSYRAAVGAAERRRVADSMGAVSTAFDLTAETIDAFVEWIRVYENKRIGVKFRFMEQVVGKIGGPQ